MQTIICFYNESFADEIYKIVQDYVGKENEVITSGIYNDNDIAFTDIINFSIKTDDGEGNAVLRLGSMTIKFRSMEISSLVEIE